MRQQTEMEDLLRKPAKKLQGISEVPEPIRANQQRIYSQLGQATQPTSTQPRWKTKRYVVAGAAAAVMVIGLGILGSGFVSPVMAEKLSRLPAIGSIFERSGDPGLQAASRLNMAGGGHLEDTHEGVTIRAQEVVYDGVRLSIGLSREGKKFEGSFQGLQLDEYGQPKRNADGAVIWNPEDTLGQGRIVKVLIDGSPLNPSEGERDSFKRAMSYVTASGKDPDSMLLSFVNNTYADNGITLPDTFTMTLVMEVTGIEESFHIDIPVQKDASRNVELASEITKIHDHLSVTVKRIAVTPVTTRIQLAVSHSGEIPERYMDQDGQLLVEHEFYDDQGQPLVWVGPDQGWIEDTAKTDDYHRVTDYLYGPLQDETRTIVVKSFYYKQDAPRKEQAKEHAGQDDFLKVYIPELELTVPVR